MPQLRGLCGHVKGEWDSHRSCMSCTGCSPSGKCSFCQGWSSATWRKAMNRRTFQSRKRESRSSRSCSRGSGSVVSGRSVIFPLPLLTSRLLATCLLRPVHRSIFVQSQFGSNHRAPFNRPRVYRPDHRPRYDCSGHWTVSVRSGHRSKCVWFSHRPFYVRFSHRPRYDRSGHRTMYVQFGHSQGVYGSITDHFVSGSVTSIGSPKDHTYMEQ